MYLQTYHDNFPEIRKWNAEVIATVKATGFLRNLFGYPREFTGNLEDESSYKEWLAFIPQSTVGCITNKAQIEMQRWIESQKLDWDILNNKHDSFLCQSPTLEIETLARKMKELIEIELVSSRGDKFRMKSEAGVGKNWGKYNELTNPEGLKEIKLAA
jgi:DNA polymerase I-like protein with 3'-5' exonuclease and polymerase domains